MEYFYKSNFKDIPSKREEYERTLLKSLPLNRVT